ncbi:glycoside hydrolase family 113 [Micromonospora purpureochromogenes]|uniref:Glycosyl hydrolase catalytic core n=1 Tax=Micromonospora purpureochromogenes TaxID=47872 RepID=A0ABX2RIM4_9ACTN|nr:hypothetical protein [Micromonospora purpureochromogenes]NYF55046.1 hypothetical protein [Micromonospora purpureochromogenes]
MRTSRAFIALLAVVLALTACTDVSSPEATQARGGSPAQAASEPAVPQVARPWQKGMPELGVNVLWEDSKDDDDEVTRAKARRLLDYLISLNVNAVAVNFPFVINGRYGTSVGAHKAHTPSPERMAILLEEAQRSRMRVAIRPLLDETSVAPAWRGKISPSSRDKWFTSYTKFLTPYAEMAREHRVAEFVVGVELNSLQGDPRWKKVVTALRSSFDGELSYSVNFDVYEDGLRTPPVDRVGVDAYFKVQADDDASVAKLTAAWERWLDRHADDRAAGLVLHEVGIAAQNGGYRHPASWGKSSVPLNLTVQRNWYQAVCNSAESRKLAGVYFWYMRMHHDPGSEDPKQADRLTFVDRPAESVLRDCYERLGA